MAQVARHASSPSPAISRPAPAPPPPLPSSKPAVRHTPRRGEQVTGRISGNATNCQETSKHTQSKVHHARTMSSVKDMLRPDSSKKQRMPKSSGGTYSKPDARVKLIPVEEITYVQHRKPHCRTVGSSGLQKKHCRRSITPPPSSRKVSVVPMPSAPSCKLSLSPKRLKTADNGNSLVGENITSSVTHHIASLKNPAPPRCKSSQPSSTSSSTGTSARDFGRMGITEAFSRYYSSRISHSQGQSSEWPDSLTKEAAIYSDSPSPKQVLASRSSEDHDHLHTKAGHRPKSVCAAESEELLSPTSVFLQQPTVKYPDRIRTPAPILRKHILQNPISLVSVRSTEVYPNSKSGLTKAAINPVSPCPKKVLSPRSSHHLDAEAGAPSKSVCTPENGKSRNTSCNIATRSTAAPVLQSSIVESARLNPTTVLDERSRESCPGGTRTAAAPIQQKTIVKHVLPSLTSLLGERCNSKAGLKEAVVNRLSPSPKQVLAPCSSEDHLGTQARPPSSSVCTPENELCTRSCNLATRTIPGPVLKSPVLESALLIPTPVLGETSTEVYPVRISTAVPTQQDPVTENVFQRPTSLLSERSTEVHPNSSTGLCSSNNLSNRKCDMVSLQHKSIPQTHSMQSTAPAQCSASINCDTSSEFRHKGLQETGSPAILHTKLHRKHYQSEAPWKGNFHVTGELNHICEGIEAQFPFQIFIRVYEASKQMPEILKLEAVALSQLWPKKFKMKPPDGLDIGLCFLSSHQRPHRSFDHLLEKISSHIGLWTNIGDNELSIFSSKLLPPDYQRKDGKFYFWGIFGKRLRKNQYRRNSHITSMKNSNLSQPNEHSDDKSEDTVTKLDAAEGKERENAQPNSYHVSSCAAPAASLINGCCNRDTANKSTFSVADSPSQLANVTSSGSDLKMDKPPGFSLKNDRVNECEVVLGIPDSNSASDGAATTSLLDGCCRHGSVNKSTSSLADSSCQPANTSSAGSDLMLDSPNEFSLKTDRINGCDVVLGTLNSNPGSSCAAPVDSLLSRCFGRDWNKSTFNLSDSLCQPANTSSVGSNFILETHRGFSLNVPPGFTKAQCRTEANDVSYVDAPLNLVMDTPAGFSNNIPPGFTEADRRQPTITSSEPETGVSTPVTEKKPLIRFSLNVPRVVKTEILPGFTKPNAVKGEPESRAVDKASEKMTPSPLASGASSVRKAGKADGITRDEATVEDENSEEREFPKIRQLSELYSQPRSCTEVCRSLNSNLADKFQAAKQPEKQRHPAKRDMKEPPEPSLADTAKRLKVNGRVALNNGMDRQTKQDGTR